MRQSASLNSVDDGHNSSRSLDGNQIAEIARGTFDGETFQFRAAHQTVEQCWGCVGLKVKGISCTESFQGCRDCRYTCNGTVAPRCRRTQRWGSRLETQLALLHKTSHHAIQDHTGTQAGAMAPCYPILSRKSTRVKYPQHQNSRQARQSPIRHKPQTFGDGAGQVLQAC